jgi:2,3-dihydroxyphenylpropionate 1,2-dioxygenase
MAVALACASHSPMLMDESLTDRATVAVAKANYAGLASFINEFAPQTIVQFSPDHFHGFHYDMMPSFCIGAAATSCGDWGTPAAAMDVDESFALRILDATRAADFDVALSYDMTVDHGFAQVWDKMFGRVDAYPCVPVFINCIAAPLPSFRRARMLGDAIGRFCAEDGRRVLFLASGGLSHDPVVPKIAGATSDVRERLVHGASFWRDLQPQREAAVRQAAAAASRGEASIIALNPEWDLRFLQILRDRDWAACDRLSHPEVTAAAGFGAAEVMVWVAAAAAAAAAGPYEVAQVSYTDVPGWIVGLATLAARGT